MAQQTVTGTLPFGLECDGVTHTEFELRPATIGDNIDAVEEVGADNNLALSVAIMARQLLKLGTLPRDKITSEVLRTARIEDWNTLDAAATSLSKKSGPPKSG